MRLSESLRRHVMETNVGVITNRFKGKSRRNVLMFEDILAEYIKECEKAGYGDWLEETGCKSSKLAMITFAPSFIKRLSITVIFNTIAKKMWINLGNIEDLSLIKDRDKLVLKTQNEVITRIIGPNRIAIGMYRGLLESILNSSVICVKALQTKKHCTYIFKSTIGNVKIISKKKKIYDRLNKILPENGVSLKDAFKKRFFQLKKNNRIYFKGRSIITVENTLIHLFGNKADSLEKLPLISFKFFRKIIKQTSSENYLILLKNILQVMGWGNVTIVKKSKHITIRIRNPPFGLQREKDNWFFLIKVIEGFLWLIEKNLKVIDIKVIDKILIATYSDQKTTRERSKKTR